MPTNRNLGFTILELVEGAARTYRAAPLNLGGLPGPGGGEGAPPGGYIGWLPQTRVAYDYSEIASSGTPASGASLLDNLNHIRYRLNILESGGSIAIVDDNTPETYYDTTHLHFSGAGVTVVDLGGGEVQVVIADAGSGVASSPITVMEPDGTPTVSNVDTIIFSGLSVLDLGSGDVLISPSGIPYSKTLFLSSTDSDISSYDTLIGEIPSNAVSTPVVTITGDTLVKAFAASPGELNFTESHVCQFFVAAYKTGGTKNLQVYVQIYRRTSSGTETLIGSSNYSSVLVTSVLTDCFFKIPITATVFNSTDRFVLKVYGHQSGSGTDPTLTFNYGGEFSNSLARISFGASDDTLDDGWLHRNETWTRTGNHVFTVTGDLTTVFRKATKVRYKDGGSYEYGVVQSSSHSSGTTTVTLITNSDYAMAAATITDTHISYIENPEGFPHWFNFAVSWTNLTVGNGTVVARWKATPLQIFYEIDMLFGSTSSISGTVSITTPVTAVISGNFPPVGLVVILDSGTATYLGQAFLLNSTTSITFWVIGASGTYGQQLALSSTVPMTWTTSDRLMSNGFYSW